MLCVYGSAKLAVSLVAVAAMLCASGVAGGPLRGAHGFSELKPGGGFKRGRSSGPCAHLGDALNAVVARAFMATTVFQGRVRSKSNGPNAAGLYAYTFTVQRVFKDGSPSLLKPRQTLRFWFKEKRSSVDRGDRGGACYQSYYNSTRPHVRADIKSGGKYIVFANGVGPHNLTAFGEPLPSIPKNRRAVDFANKNKYQAANVTGLLDTQLKVQEKLKLVCRSSGHPLPAISWYRNGNRINVSSNTTIVFKKKRSVLKISSVDIGDSGLYECRATTVRGNIVSTSARVTVVPPPDNTTTLWPMVAGPCFTVDFCLNGGTCSYYETVGELVCQCAEGYKGQRCEEKDVYNHSNSSPETWDRGSPTRIMTFY